MMYLLPSEAHLSTVSLTPVINLYYRISPRIFVKILEVPKWILRGRRKRIHEKNLESIISCQAPFKDWCNGRPSTRKKKLHAKHIYVKHRRDVVYRKYKNIHDPGFSRHAQLTPALNLKMQYHLMYVRTLAPIVQKPNSWTYNFVEVSWHTLESSQTGGFCMDFLNQREEGMFSMFSCFLLYSVK